MLNTFSPTQANTQVKTRLYGAWITPKGNLINVSEYDGHYTYAALYLKHGDNPTTEQRNNFYKDMFNAGFMRLMYTRKGYTIEKGQGQIIKMSQLSYIENADSVDVYYHR